MGFEIERKFLVDTNNQELQSIMQNKPVTITQGYLENSKDHPIVFVTTGEKSFLNIILENFDKIKKYFNFNTFAKLNFQTKLFDICLTKFIKKSHLLIPFLY